MITEDAPRKSHARELTLALALVAVGALGLWPGARGEPDPLALLVWLALVSVPVGYFGGASGLRAWPWAAMIPAAWMGVESVADALSRRDLPAPAWAALAFTGLFALGFGAGRAWPGPRWRVTSALLLGSALLASLPLLGLELESAFPTALRARLLDLSPVTFVCECAGVDWMRQPVIYDALQTVDIDPSMRGPWSGALAGGIAFVVGSLAATSADCLAARRAPRTSRP